MQLNQLKDNEGARHRKMRIGRGIGSGRPRSDGERRDSLGLTSVPHLDQVTSVGALCPGSASAPTLKYIA